jgi:hypothetical protein
LSGVLEATQLHNADTMELRRTVYVLEQDLDWTPSYPEKENRLKPVLIDLEYKIIWILMTGEGQVFLRIE